MCVSLLAEFFAIVFVFLGGPAPGACFDRAVKNVELFFFVQLLSIVFLGFDFRWF